MVYLLEFPFFRILNFPENENISEIFPGISENLRDPEIPRD